MISNHLQSSRIPCKAGSRAPTSVKTSDRKHPFHRSCGAEPMNKCETVHTTLHHTRTRITTDRATVPVGTGDVEEEVNYPSPEGSGKLWISSPSHVGSGKLWISSREPPRPLAPRAQVGLNAPARVPSAIRLRPVPAPASPAGRVARHSSLTWRWWLLGT